MEGVEELTMTIITAMQEILHEIIKWQDEKDSQDEDEAGYLWAEDIPDNQRSKKGHKEKKY